MKYFSRDEVERIGRAGVMTRTEDDYMFCRVLSSFWLAVEPEDRAFTPHMKRDGFWEAWNTKWVSQEFDDHNLFLDIGANVGYYTMLAAMHGLETYAFEPNPLVNDLIHAGVTENKLEDRVTISDYALSDTEGDAFISIHEFHSGAGGFSKSGMKVSTITGDQFLDGMFNRDILIKCDAEGAEPNIMWGLEQTLEQNECTIFLEWDGQRYEDTKDDFLNTLSRYSLAMVNDEGSEDVISTESLARMNGLYTVVVRNY